MIFLFLKTSLPLWKPSIVDNLFFKLNERDGGRGGCSDFSKKIIPIWDQKRPKIDRLHKQVLTKHLFKISKLVMLVALV